jgi:hypothetical protein
MSAFQASKIPRSTHQIQPGTIDLTGRSPGSDETGGFGVAIYSSL